MLKASKHEAPLKIRSPHRVVEDYDVDRLQVHGRQRPQPSNTNNPNPFLGATLPSKNKSSAARKGERERQRRREAWQDDKLRLSLR